MVMSMKKRLLSFFLVLAIALYCAMSVFAVDTGVDIIDDPLSYYFQNQLLGTYKGTGVSLYCPECDYKVEYTGGTLVTCPYDGAQLLLAGKYGVKATPIDMKNAGSNVPPGGRNPKGYQNETGVPSVNSTGVLCMVVEPLGMCSNWTDKGFYTNDNRELIVGASSSGASYPSDDEVVVYKFVTPASGTYYIGNLNGSSYNYGSISIFSSNAWRLKYLTRKCTEQYEYTGKFDAGQTVYFRDHTRFYHYDQYDTKYFPKGAPYKFSLNPICIFYEPYDTSVNKQTNITINNNTWNGNIYVDNTNKLTYIYPQYTTINENNETVTNISNNPIIYNQETKQYYTYDQTTNNYYYITYGDPAPTPTPSPSPDPGGSTPDPGKPTPTPTPGGSGGGSGDTPSGGGSNWWDKLLDGILSGLLEGIKGILKLLFDLFSSILGWIIWLCSKVFDLFPFLPPGVGALLVGGVVVCFILAFIKFIRG